VIIGKLIPAGTGMAKYRDIATDAPDYEPLPFYTSDTEAEMDLASWLADSARTAAPEETGAFGDGGFLTVAPEPSDAELAAVEAALEGVAEDASAQAGAAVADVAGLIASDADPPTLHDAEDRAESALSEAHDAAELAEAAEALIEGRADEPAAQEPAAEPEPELPAPGGSDTEPTGAPDPILEASEAGSPPASDSSPDEEDAASGA